MIGEKEAIFLLQFLLSTVFRFSTLYLIDPLSVKPVSIKSVK